MPRTKRMYRRKPGPKKRVSKKKCPNGSRRKRTKRKRKTKVRKRKFSMANLPQFEYDKHPNLKRVKSDAGMTRAIKTCDGKCLFIFYMQGCPYCRDLRQIVSDLCKSGHKVIVFERNDIGSKYKSYTSDGFPSIYKAKGGELVKFSDSRTLGNFKNFLN